MNFLTNNNQIKNDLTPEELTDAKPDNRNDEERFDDLILKKEQAPEPEDNYSRVKRETSWMLTESLPNKVPNLSRVARGLDRCSLCDGKGYLTRLLIGETTGGKTIREFGCPCVRYKAFEFLLNRDVPPHDRHIKFDALAPSEKSFMPLPLQNRLIPYLKANAGKNWAMFGPAGWSKTTFCLVLWEHAVKREIDKAFPRCRQNLLNFVKNNFPVCRVSAKRMLQEIADYENYDFSECRPAEPMVTERKIRQAAYNGHRPSLFIEEIDKINNLTKPRLNTLFGIIQEIYAQNGQVCLNSNMALPVFEAEFGPDLFRRVSEPEHSIVLDLFDPRLTKEE